jgi:uncharacterized protein YciI
MKTVVFYELGNVSMDLVRQVYPRHKKIVDEFHLKGKLIAVGTWANPSEGAMGVFTDRQSAEEFVKIDPFMLEGLVGKVNIKDWNEILLGG